MSGLEETLSEKITKPLLFNPLLNHVGVILTGLGALFTNFDNDTLRNIGEYVLFFGVGTAFWGNVWGAGFYLRDKKLLKKGG